MREKLAKAVPDAWVAQLAARQHGLVAVTQLLAAGLTYEGIRRRVRTGRLHRIHRGVYAVGHRNLSHQGRWMAAVLACGEGAALSHRSAGMHWALIKPSTGTVDVTVPTNSGRAGARASGSTALRA